MYIPLLLAVHIEGSLFEYERKTLPRFKFMVIFFEHGIGYFTVYDSSDVLDEIYLIL